MKKVLKIAAGIAVLLIYTMAVAMCFVGPSEMIEVEVTRVVEVERIVEVEVTSMVEKLVTVTPTKTPKYTPTITLTPTETSIPTNTSVPTATIDPLKKPKGSGFYLVGVDIAPGLWRSASGYSGCYWAITSKTGSIINNHFGESGCTCYIPAHAFQVEFSDCGQWEWLGQ